MSNDSFAQPHTALERSQSERSSDMPSEHTLAQAQLGSGTFSTVIAVSDGNFNAPQMRILQTNNNDFARLRLSVQNQAFWDIATVFDRINFFAQLHGDVMTLHSNGNLSITGTFTQGSSRTLKDQITELSSTEALETLAHLSPVKFRYKADTEQATHVGFIAEDVPELVATPNRQVLSAMDIVGVLTKAVQEQQKTIVILAEKVQTLEGRNGVN